MYLVREIMYCKPGKVRSLLEKMKTMSRLGEKAGMPKLRLLTDFAAERYWTLIGEMEVPDIDTFQRMMSGPPAADEDMKELEEAMQGYHDLVEYGRREIYKIES